VATKKDLVEAYSFSRRRLVTAFVSGAPGGREVEPARPGRTIVGGLALAVLLVAGAAIAGVFSPTAPDDWKQQGLIISRDNGSAYVIVDDSDDPELRPVLNSTSAALILGADVKPTLLSQDTIDEQRIGADIGIFGAPASVPTSGLLLDDGWTACTAADAGIRLRLSPEPDVVPAPRAAVTVRNGDDYFVVAPTSDSAATGAADPGAYVFPVPLQGRSGDQTDNLLSALGVPITTQAIPVSREWINLFPTGAPLDWSSFGLTAFGTTPTYAADDETGVLRDTLVGDLLTVGDEHLLLTDSGPVALSDFAATVYANVVAPDNAVVTPKPVSAAPRVPRSDVDPLADAHWPVTTPSATVAEPCAQLSTEPGQPPVAHLVAAGPESGVGDLAAGSKAADVASGRGAYVLSGGWQDTDQGSPYLVDGKGRANPLLGDDAAERLGYADYPVVVVPDTWVELFRCGVVLSPTAALSPPTEPDDDACA
jgi:ESX secretion system ATPase EccB